MSNPDIPSLELCKRLARVWPSKGERDGLWYDTNGEDLCWIAGEDGGDEGEIPARTIGEMLEEAKREGWVTEHHTAHTRDGRQERWEIHTESLRKCLGSRAAKTHADALAAALAESLEKKRERP